MSYHDPISLLYDFIKLVFFLQEISKVQCAWWHAPRPMPTLHTCYCSYVVI